MDIMDITLSLLIVLHWLKPVNKNYTLYSYHYREQDKHL